MARASLEPDKDVACTAVHERVAGNNEDEDAGRWEGGSNSFTEASAGE